MQWILFWIAVLTVGLEARLLVQLDSPFSAEEFAKRSGAYLVKVDTCNPYKDLNKIFLKEDFVVLSETVGDEVLLKRLSSKFGYRCISFKREIGLEEAAICARKLFEMSPRKGSEVTPIAKEEAIALYNLMEKVDSILGKEGISYWAVGGTLLGAIRSKGLIPWDDDLDICIFEADEKRLIALKDELKKQGLGLYYYEQKEFYKIYPLNGTPIEDRRNPGALRDYCHPFIDVFVMALPSRKEELDIYAHKSCYFFRNFPEETFTYDQIKNLKRIPFGPITIPVPSGAEEWLNRNYGVAADPGLWKKYGLEPTRSHRLEAEVSAYAGACLVQLDDLSPAPWK